MCVGYGFVWLGERGGGVRKWGEECVLSAVRFGRGKRECVMMECGRWCGCGCGVGVGTV